MLTRRPPRLVSQARFSLRGRPFLERISFSSRMSLPGSCPCACTTIVRMGVFVVVRVGMNVRLIAFSPHPHVAHISDHLHLSDLQLLSASGLDDLERRPFEGRLPRTNLEAPAHGFGA